MKTGMMTLIELTKKVLPHQMTTLPCVITTQTLRNLSLAVITYAELESSLITQEEENLVL